MAFSTSDALWQEFLHAWPLDRLRTQFHRLAHDQRHHVVGDRSILRDVRYCLTLDSDTRLPRDAARELIGSILHPLNQPEVDPVPRRLPARTRTARVPPPDP